MTHFANAVILKPLMAISSEILKKLKIRFERTRLENGLEVLTFEDHRVPVVSIQVWYRVGSRYEYPGISGISHLLEHMMFKGTKKYGPEEFSAIVQSFGGYDNAMTWKDETVYFSLVPSSKLELLLEMEADRMQNLTFREFDKELNVVKEERKLTVENYPEGKLFEEIFLTAYEAHPYRIPVIGFASDLENMTLEKVREYYESHYSPRNAFLLVGGDVKTEEVFRLADKYFGGIQNRGTLEHDITQEPPQEGIKIREIFDKNGLINISTFSYHVPEFKHEDTPALSILNDVLGGGRSSRLYEKLVYKKKLASSVDVTLLSLKDPGLLIFHIHWNENVRVERGEAVLKDEIERIKNEGVSEEELEKSRKKVLANFVYKQETTLDMSFMLGEYTILATPDYINKYPEKLLQVSREDVRKVAQKYLNDDNLTVVRLRKK